MSEICYQKNYLQEVVARIDFAAPLEALNAPVLPDKVQKALKSRYPIFESTKAVSQNVIIHHQSIHTDRREVQQWKYHGENREKSITVSPDFIIVSIKQYRDYEEFKLDVIEPIEEISKIEGNIFINRTGLRYINIFPNKTNKYDELIDKFHPTIASPFSNIIDANNLSRKVQLSEYINDEVKCRIQSGIFNPDYPAKIKNKEFVLDLDAFIDTPHSFANINELFDSLHNVIQNKFEDLITTKLRDELNEQ
jgi:uncharacterized protein (TIGR04255 family)